MEDIDINSKDRVIDKHKYTERSWGRFLINYREFKVRGKDSVFDDHTIDMSDLVKRFLK